MNYSFRVADLLELSVVVDDDGDVDDEFRQLARLDLVSCEEAKNMVEMDIVNVLLNAVKGMAYVFSSSTVSFFIM